jgi:SAM-dependent MidA family methyltransferase
LVSEYLLKYFPYEDLVIYETGAGNGTLALNVLDFLAREHPEVYERTQYNIVEISSSLAKLQQARLSERHSCVKIYNKSIFDWNFTEHAPCFVVALEVVVSVFFVYHR